MERIDKIVSHLTGFTRTQVKSLIKNGEVLLNSECVKKPEQKTCEGDAVCVMGINFIHRKNIYLIMNKPEGIVSATQDKDPTVIDIIPPELNVKGIFPVGRLDKDTTGIILLTTDGDFAHKITSPKKDIKKTYEVDLDREFIDSLEVFSHGITLKDGDVCKGAMLQKKDDKILISISEGKYHQVKRMFAAIGYTVINLKRISIGSLYLPDDLEEGAVRELSQEEMSLFL